MSLLVSCDYLSDFLSRYFFSRCYYGVVSAAPASYSTTASFLGFFSLGVFAGLLDWLGSSVAGASGVSGVSASLASFSLASAIFFAARFYFYFSRFNAFYASNLASLMA